MPTGRYFLVKSFLNGKVLDILEKNAAPGASVAMYTVSPNAGGTDNQLWTYHVRTLTIRSKLNGYCLDVKGGTVEMQPYGPGAQEWLIDGNVIKSRDHPDKVLDIIAGNKDNGAKLCVHAKHGADNQRWKIEHVNQPYFYIKSCLNERVMDITASNRGRGAEVIMWNKGESCQDNQLWYEDEFGRIRSKLNYYVFDSSGHPVTMQPYQPNKPNRMWEIEGELIVNHAKKDEVLDIAGGKTEAGATLCSFRCHGGSNQRWKFEHV